MTLPPDNFIAVLISSFGILLCLSVGGSLFFRKDGIKQANLFLGLLLVLYSFTLLNLLMAMTGVFSTYQQLYFLPLAFSWSVGPLFYFFVRSRIQPTFTFRRKHLIHFVLPAVQFLFYASIGFRSVAFKSWMWQQVIQPYVQYLEGSLTVVLGGGYLLAAIRLINREVPVALWKHPICRWLRRFALALLVLLSVSALYDLADWVLWNGFQYNLYNTPWADFPLKMSYAAISIFIGYNAFVHQNQALITPGYFKDGTENHLEERIQELMAKQQVFLDPELKLEGLAKMLGVSKNKLSQFFSANGESFRSFINRRRVDYFLALVEEGKHQQLSILGLAYESGFNSKASFNRVFKALKGQTPSAYISEHLSSGR